jgi:hypothetical protein
MTGVERFVQVVGIVGYSYAAVALIVAVFGWMLLRESDLRPGGRLIMSVLLGGYWPAVLYGLWLQRRSDDHA